MLSVALQTLRTRWITFVGGFVALALGVGLIATTGLALASSLDAPEHGPERFARASAVLRPPDTLRVPTPVGERVKPLAAPKAVTPEQAAKAAAAGRTVEDRSFPVRAEGGPRELVGHPWSTAAFAPYELSSGRAPRAPGEVVVTGDWAKPGQSVRTARGKFTVVGTARDLGFEDAVFYTDRQAASLSPRIDQLAVEGPAGEVRAAVGGLRVLTGEDRRFADADPDRDGQALVAVNAMLGTAAGMTGFVSVFVVASTFAFAVAQRRREFGLLRTAGATPGQIRRMVTAEALLIGVLASAAGCALGAWGAPRLAAYLVDNEVAPPWFTIGDDTWPYHLAFWTGLLVALAGVVAASWRAGRVGPAEALRDASVDTRTMTWGRWLFGGGLLVAGIGTLVFALMSQPGELLHRKTYTSRPMLLITAFALLAPVLVRPLTRLLAWLPAQLPGAGGMLVRENAAAGVRRTAAVAAPVLVMVALAGSLLGATATLNEAKATEVRERTAADFVVTGAGPGGFDRAAVERMRQIPGARVTPSAESAVFVLEEGVALIRSDARAVEPAGLGAAFDLPLAAGTAAGLDDRSIIVNDEWERHTVGDTVDVWLGDGTRASLTIAAVMRTGTGGNGVYITPRNAAGAPVDRVDVTLAAGADRAAVAEGLREAADPLGASVRSREAWIAASYPETSRQTRVGYLVVLGIALLYTGIALANTLVMAASDRVRELAVLRLAGATGAQVLRLVAAEAAMVVVVGGVLGTVVAGLNLAGLWAALGVLGAGSPVVVPWETLGAAVGACGVIAVVCAVVPAGLSLRIRPVELAGVRE
ncbi:FtsX-like permease family protein [Streptomyces sp. NPDC051018]|uniref:FtsX-like permease family protein n=1 Tax=Streptomyces sp. NPDC051018 TaxID=3365639 RepID=UPI0037A782CC